ncbi:ester cyclase [Epibacterium ulvae]|uniref:ester cyclase n=1 Tax=Epibacterium ulvae TaxID=1156985 RepID=UPI0024920811|nr:ester cyclase [Epibacterium ulvae]
MKPLKHIALTVAATATFASAVFANDAVETMAAFYEIADARPFDGEKLSTFISHDFFDHTNNIKPQQGPAGGIFQMLADGAPDSHHEIEMIEPVGDDKALIIWRYVGTNTDGLFGVPAKTPANAFSIPGMELWEVKEGKITGLWHVEDILGLMNQLNVE